MNLLWWWIKWIWLTFMWRTIQDAVSYIYEIAEGEVLLYAITSMTKWSYLYEDNPASYFPVLDKFTRRKLKTKQAKTKGTVYSREPCPSRGIAKNLDHSWAGNKLQTRDWCSSPLNNLPDSAQQTGASASSSLFGKTNATLRFSDLRALSGFLRHDFSTIRYFWQFNSTAASFSSNSVLIFLLPK